jgi:ribosomal protein S18 acetylase RimI-like enzyme
MTLSLRPLAADDADLVCRHREQMFLEAGRAASDLAVMGGPFRAWLMPRLSDGRYFGFIALAGDAPIGGVGLMEIDWPPHPAHPHDDRRGYVLNLFVDPQCRGRGAARALMEASHRELERRDLRYLVLHATQAGRPLYEKLGWASTTEMARIALRSGKTHHNEHIAGALP